MMKTMFRLTNKSFADMNNIIVPVVFVRWLKSHPMFGGRYALALKQGPDAPSAKFECIMDYPQIEMSLRCLGRKQLDTRNIG